MQSRKLSLRTICCCFKNCRDIVTPQNLLALWRPVFFIYIIYIYIFRFFKRRHHVASVALPSLCLPSFSLNAKRRLLAVEDGGAERFPANLREKEQSCTVSRVSSPSVASFLLEVRRSSLRRNSDGGRKKKKHVKTKRNTRRLRNQPCWKDAVQFTFQPQAFFFQASCNFPPFLRPRSHTLSPNSIFRVITGVSHYWSPESDLLTFFLNCAHV